MKKEISGKDWNGHCPFCNHEEYTHTDIDYDVSINGWVCEQHECDACGQEFEVIWGLTLDGVIYEVPDHQPQTDGPTSFDEKMASIRKVLRPDNPDTEK